MDGSRVVDTLINLHEEMSLGLQGELSEKSPDFALSFRVVQVYDTTDSMLLFCELLQKSYNEYNKMIDLIKCISNTVPF